MVADRGQAGGVEGSRKRARQQACWERGARSGKSGAPRESAKGPSIVRFQRPAWAFLFAVSGSVSPRGRLRFLEEPGEVGSQLAAVVRKQRLWGRGRQRKPLPQGGGLPGVL